MPNIIVPVAATGLPTVTPAMRRRMERAVERLIATLDALDAPVAELEPDSDLEPTLGATEAASPTRWYCDFNADECELVSEDEGACIQSQPHDAEPDEPTLGAPENPHDQTRWAQGANGEDEAEPDELGRQASYLPYEQAMTNRSAAKEAERQATAILDRKHGRRSVARGDLIPLLGTVLPFAR